MGNVPTALTGPDLEAGVALSSIVDGGMMHGHAFGAHVLLVRRGEGVRAIGAHCTHYGVALVDGLVVGNEVRCPLHHACFSIETGAALRAPAFDALARWATEVRNGQVFVTHALAPDSEAPTLPLDPGDAGIVIVGGGAAGNAAAEMLRSEGYRGPVTMISADTQLPVDRPNFSKGTITGTIPHEFNFLRPASFYAERNITLKLDTRVTSIDGAQKFIELASGERINFRALLIATGADPIKLDTPGANLPHVFTVRSLGDSEAIAANAANARSAVVIGASFIGMEAAAALRSRGLAVHVVAPDAIPMARVLGDDIGVFMRQVHDNHGVTFHLGTTVATIESNRVILASGEIIDADLVVTGVGVRPSVELATRAGLMVDNGVIVDAYLETSTPGIFAAGDIARWPDAHSGASMRVEHWVVAERQGQTAARNMLGQREAFDAVPFFWTEQYDVTLLYVGHAERGFTATLTGSLDPDAPNARVDYRQGETLVAVATIGRDRESLEVEIAMERVRKQVS